MNPSGLRRLLAALLLGLVVLGLVLLWSGQQAQATTDQATIDQAATAVMRLGSEEGFLVFQPERLTIAAGERVRFEVGGLGPHNLIVDSHPEWSHEPLSFVVGESWDQQFDTPGRYAIWCEPHRAAGMTGEINVVAAENATE
ncbi:plastocyanin/azurin family copper-binding protein [Synechococcus sp. 8F6]|uniref:plastocyanin/azurin family copper-binding protein n=1 Tax=Synechococcus sp. 8F6 TaxID=2025606 RepID=UPI000B97DC48|nr:plastocyanin/azurin family copper-binding protein [Synechococcus sp. 8F6]